jgi:hypothetical protein
MGGWLGRLAARYRMRVEEFAEGAGVDCDLAPTNVGWLLAPPLSARAIERLALQTRCAADRIRALQTPPEWLSDRSHLPYCFTCLFVNPLDAGAPRWKREWLHFDAEDCSDHGWPLRWIPVGKVRRCGHFGSLLKTISSREAERRWLQGHARY